MKLCLDNMQRNEDALYNLGMYPCHAKLSQSQVMFMLFFFVMWLWSFVYCLESFDSRFQPYDTVHTPTCYNSS